MASRSGPFKTLRDSAVFAATGTWYACTNVIRMGAQANSLLIYAQSATASPGNVDFYIAHSTDDDGTGATGTFYSLTVAGETPEVYGPIAFSAADQSMSLRIPALPPLEFVKVYFRASANATSAKLEIKALSYLDESGTASAEISVGDIEVSTEVMDDWDESDRCKVNPIVGQAGVAAGAVAMGATVQCITIATDDTHFGAVGAAADVDGVVHGQLRTIGTSVEIMDDWDESDRAKVNPIVGQAGIAAGAQAMGATVPCITIATDDTHFGSVGAASDVDGVAHAQLRYIGDGVDAVETTANAIQTAVEIMDDWDESDRAKVNPIVGQAGIAAGAQAMGATVPCVTIATDDTHFGSVGAASDVDGAVHSQLRFIGESVDGVEGDLTAIKDAVEIMDDWDESDRCKVSPIVGQAGVAAGAQAMGATVQCITIATDDTHFGAVGAASDIDGAIHAQLRYANDYLVTINTDTGTIAGDTTSIDGKTPALGTAAMAASSPVTIATDDTILSATNALLTTIDADTGSIATDAGTIAGDTTSIDGKTPALGTAAMAASSPITIATDDTMFAALDTAVDVIAGDTTSIDGKTPALGTAAMAASSPVTIATDDTILSATNALLTTIDANTGSIATDAGTIAGDTTSIDGKTPVLGTAAMVASSPITIATDDTMFTALDTAVDIIAGDTTSIDGKTPALGTAAMAASSPITIATDDTMFTALDTALDVVAGDTTSIDGKTPALGSAAMAASSPVTIATDDTMFTALDTAVDAAVTALQIMDDWDDGSDHCEVVDPNRAVLVSASTGSAAINIDTAFAAEFELDSITLHLSAAATTSENFVITLDANAGAAYDTKLYTEDLGTTGTTDLVLLGGVDLPKKFDSGDEIDIDWTNTDTRTYGVRIVYRLV